MATGHKLGQYAEPSLLGAPAATKLQSDANLVSSRGLSSPRSHASTMLPESPAGPASPASVTSIGEWRPFSQEARSDMTHQDRQQLIDQVIALEADVRAMQQEAERWRLRCLESERDRAAAAAAEDRAQLDLRDAHERERKLAAQSVEMRLRKAEVDNSILQSEAEVRRHQHELQMQDEKLKGKEEDLNFLRTELHRMRACSQEQDALLRARESEAEAAQAELQRLRLSARIQEERTQVLEADIRSVRNELREALDYGESRRVALERIEKDHAEELERERSGRLLALSNAKEHSNRLEAQNKELQVALSSATSSHSELNREAECLRTKSNHLDTVNQKLRLDLQEAIHHTVRSGAMPFYHGGAVHTDAPDGVESRELTIPKPPSTDMIPRPPVQAVPMSPRRSREASLNPIYLPTYSAKSRLDYPRGSCSRRLRREVLTARTSAPGRYDEHGSLVSFDAQGRAV